jgi:hypothetical protein
VSQPVAALLPDYSYGARNERYKLVRKTVTNYDPQNPDLGDACLTITSDEFYTVDQTPGVPKLDRPTGELANNLLAPGTAPGTGSSQLNPVLKANYDALVQSLTSMLNSYKACPGDANLTASVNAADLREQTRWMRITGNTSTWWDMNGDGYTDRSDKTALARLTSSVCTLLPGQSR